MMLTQKRVLIPILLSLVIAGFFMANVEITGEMASVSALFVVLFAMPSYYAVVKHKGKKAGLLLLIVLGVYALIIESLAIHTSFPYGDFTYNDSLGSKVFGLTPWTVSFAYPPILLLAYTVACTRRNLVQVWWKLALATGLLAMAIDLVLDPGAVALGFWYWPNGGFFYEVPLVILGWIVTGAIGGLLVRIFWGKKAMPLNVMTSGLLILWFWTWINVWLAHWLPALIGFILLYAFISIKTKKNV